MAMGQGFGDRQSTRTTLMDAVMTAGHPVIA
jgi:hypothetical protein